MIYYEDESYIVRTMEERDVQELVQGEIAQGWQATDDKYLLRLKDQREEKCIALIVECGHSAVDYVSVYFNQLAGPFVDSGYPEIVDLGVLEKYRKLGVGSLLMDTAEKIAFEISDGICIGVGLHSGYGSAQRMYVKRGYIPDGSSVWYRDAVCEQYAECCNDDDLVLYFSKQINVSRET